MLGKGNRLVGLCLAILTIVTPVTASIGWLLLDLNAGLAVAQTNDETAQKERAELREDMDEYEEALAVLPAISARLDAMDKTNRAAIEVHREFLAYIREASVADAKAHHTHNGRVYD